MILKHLIGAGSGLVLAAFAIAHAEQTDTIVSEKTLIPAGVFVAILMWSVYTTRKYTIAEQRKLTRIKRLEDHDRRNAAHIQWLERELARTEGSSIKEDLKDEICTICSRPMSECICDYCETGRDDDN